MNALARQYKPAATADGTPRSANGSFNKKPQPRTTAASSPKSSSFHAAVPQSTATSFDYDAEIRRLTGTTCLATDSPPVSRGASFANAPSSPSRFRWVQPRDEDTLPPPHKPERVMSAAAKARNQMYRPMATSAAPDPASDAEWRKMSAAQRAASILQGRA